MILTYVHLKELRQGLRNTPIRPEALFFVAIDDARYPVHAVSTSDVGEYCGFVVHGSCAEAGQHHDRAQLTLAEFERNVLLPVERGELLVGDAFVAFKGQLYPIFMVEMDYGRTDDNPAYQWDIILHPDLDRPREAAFDALERLCRCPQPVGARHFYEYACVCNAAVAACGTCLDAGRIPSAGGWYCGGGQCALEQ